MFHEIVAMVPRPLARCRAGRGGEHRARARGRHPPGARYVSRGAVGRQGARRALRGIDRFDVVVTRDDVTVGKPTPVGVRPRLRTTRGGCRARPRVRGRTSGVVAAVAAGVGHVVGVTTSFSQQVLRDSGAHATMRDHGHPETSSARTTSTRPPLTHRPPPVESRQIAACTWMQTAICLLSTRRRAGHSARARSL